MANKDVQEIIICLDAGHYAKYNRSPANKAYYESEAMWKLHVLQKKYLEEYGFKVIITREDIDTDLALKLRGQKAKGCVLFISNHSNAVGSYVKETVDYVAVYRLTDDSTTNCDDISKEIGDVLAPVIAEQMGVSQGYRVVTRKSGSDRNGDGMMNDNYYGVLHGARTVNVPGLILEHSFHTNTKSTNWLLNDDNLDRLAKAEAVAIAKYFGMTKVQDNESKEDTLYRVQVGAYKVIENAKAQYEKVRAAGFDAFMVQIDGFYKIQVGAYSVKSNAENQLAKLKAAGFDAFITTTGGKAVSETSTQTTVNPAKKDELEVNGEFDEATVLKSQKVFGTKEDGIVSNQPTTCQEYLPNAKESAWEFDKKENCEKGSALIRAIQTFLQELGYYAGKIDGWCGKKTVIAIQNFLKDKGFYTGLVDGKMGPKTVKAWQQYINSRL